MKNRFWNKKIPTFIGIILIAIGIGVTTFLVKQGGFVAIRANPSEEPKEVRITNITNNSFTISYITEGFTTGSINFGETTALGQNGLDTKDQNSGKVGSYQSHFIKVDSLSPNKKYYFTILSGKDVYTNNSNPFEVITGIDISTNPFTQDPITGKVLLPDGKPPKDTIVYLTVDGSQVLSTQVKQDGTFLIPLNSLRTANLSTYFKIENNSIIRLLIVGSGMQSNVILQPQNNPVPLITLSKNYDFISPNNLQNTTVNPGSFPSFTTQENNSKNGSVQIIVPQKNQSFTDLKPQFKGTAFPNQEVEVLIQSENEIKTTVKSDINGNWSYRPSASLTPGKHTITITTKDASGILKKITQSFVVYASGSQIQGEAGSPTPTKNPKATTTPTPTKLPTSTPTVTKTPTRTPTPTIISGNKNTPTPTSISPTLTLTITNSPTISPTEIVSETTISPTSPLPPTGNPAIITTGIVGVLTTLIGSLLYLLTKKDI